MMTGFFSLCSKTQKMSSHFSSILLSIYRPLATASGQPLLISCTLHSPAGTLPSHILWTQKTLATEIHNYFLLFLRLSWLWKLPGFADITLVWRRIGLTAENIHVNEWILLRKRKRKTNSTRHTFKGHCSTPSICDSAPWEGKEEVTPGGIS